MKVYYQWKYKFCRLCIRNMASGFLRIGRKLEKWQWCHNFPTWRHRQIFGRCFVSLVKFSYWSKFHVNIITGSRVWQFLFIRGWPEIRKSEIPLSEFSTISRRLGQARNTKFGTNVSNKMLLNAGKCQGYSFYRLWVINGN